MRRLAVGATVIAAGLVIAPAAIGKAHTTSKTLDPAGTIRVHGKDVRIRNLKVRVVGPHGGSQQLGSFTAPKRGTSRMRTTFYYGNAIKLDIRLGPHRAYARWREGRGAGVPYPPRVVVHWADR
jgi:hypothetical protein